MENILGSALICNTRIIVEISADLNVSFAGSRKIWWLLWEKHYFL